ncbi:MAG TPA: type 2 lanthipeptide synthetase LanM family protein [Pyrinomonadaceae bacterium]|jgi:type 2 lantibiotic biosynthesis protein LanM|nr:type 2 lanthipeptide synthetase LanM family protein [Pyrinomonadaceae bacterium]
MTLTAADDGREQIKTDALLAPASWYAALTLSERVALLRSDRGGPPSFEGDDALAERRLRGWRSQAPFDQASYFGQRLAADGISEEEFRQVLGESLEAVRARHSAIPRWLSVITEAFGNLSTAEGISASPEQFETGPRALSFIALVEPLVGRGRARLREEVKSLSAVRSTLPFDPETIEELLYESLPARLVMRLSRTLALELNVARLQGLLAGETPAERFRSFINRLREPENALAILGEYPVLARQIATQIDQWVESSREFLRDLCADREEVAATFCEGKEPGVLVKVSGGVGDSHRRGRSVLIAEFRSGFRVVYKPRPLAVDLRFQELLSWLNERGAQPPLAPLEVLDRRDHGWVEFISAGTCQTAEEVRRFYRRQGGYLALLYALEASDFHFENLIAAGEHPFMIDLEALFQSRVGGEDLRQADALASTAAAHSVLRVGLLPQRAYSKDDYEGVDVSGLGGAPGQLSPHRVMRWEGAGTDEMRVVRERVEVSRAGHRPTLEGRQVNVLNLRRDLAEGFTDMYRLLLTCRQELLSDDGPLSRFNGAEVRAIVRDTHAYDLLLQESFHPDFLHDALDRDLFLDRLWAGVPERPYLARVVGAERCDLLEGDIPIFNTLPEYRCLWSGAGERIDDFFDEPGMALARRRIERLCARDLRQQLWFLDASLTTLSIDLYRDNWPNYPVSEPNKKADRRRLLDAARGVGDRLDELALRTETEATWIGVAGVDGRHCSLAPLDSSLYEGVPGVALFLAYLGAVCGEERYVVLARLALATMRRQARRLTATMERVGAFAGWGGFIYTLAHLGRLWDEPSLWDEADEMVERVSALVERDDTFDIINGSAGCIASLIALYKCQPKERTLEEAVRCGNHLVACAQRKGAGLAWDTKVPARELPSGFAHGTAGIAWALMELWALTGAESFRAAALAGTEYERGLFSKEAGAWVDGRDLGSFGRIRRGAVPEAQGETNVATWCYGAPGIGLSLLGVLRHTNTPAIKEEVERALHITLEQGFGLNHSLCHGDLGNIELLLQASGSLANPEWQAQLERVTSIVLESVERHGWLCGIPLGVESPGLMPGLAGIGYQLLRLAEPEFVPSLLTLDQPPLKAACRA